MTYQTSLYATRFKIKKDLTRQKQLNEEQVATQEKAKYNEKKVP